MKRYTIWETAPMIWHTLLMFISVPLSILTGLADLWSAVQPENSLAGTGFEALGASMLLFSTALVGALIAAEVGLVRRKWFGPCALWVCYGIQILFGLMFVAIGAMIGDSLTVSDGLGRSIAAGIFLAICVVYYQKRRALFAPAPLWFTPVETNGDVWTEKKPEVLTMEKQESAGGYSTLYQTAAVEKTQEPVAVLEKEPEVPDRETEDGVELLMRLQAEEEAKRGASGPPTPPEKKKGAPVWSVIALGALCVALAVTAGVMGWQAFEAGRQRDELSAQVEAVQESEKKLAGELRQVTLDRDANAAQRDVAEATVERWKPELDFWTSYGCIVVVGDSQYYHDYRCSLTEGKDFFIFNTASAQTRGYHSCAICNPNSSLDKLGIFAGSY